MTHIFIKYTNNGLGIKANLIVQLIRYMSNGENSPLVDGYQWAYLSYKKISELTGISLSSVRRVVAKLQEEGILILNNFNKHKFDRTFWYRINEEVLAEKMKTFSKEKNQEKVDTTKCSKWTHANVQGEHLPVSTMSTCKCSQRHDDTKNIKEYIKDHRGESDAIASRGQDPKYKKTLAETLSDYKPKVLLSKIEKESIKKQNSSSAFFTIFFLLMEERYNRKIKLSPTSKERGLVSSVIKNLKINNLSVSEFLTYTFDNWSVLRQKLVWDDSKKPRLSDVPNITEICFVHKDIIDAILQHPQESGKKVLDKDKIRELYERRKHGIKNK